MPTLASLPAELVLHILSFVPPHLRRPAHHALTLQSHYFYFLLGPLPRPRLTEPEDRIVRPVYSVESPICFRCFQSHQLHDVLRFSLWRDMHLQRQGVVSFRIYCLPCARHMCASTTFREAIIPNDSYWLEQHVVIWCPGCERFEIPLNQDTASEWKRKYWLPLRMKLCKMARDKRAEMRLGEQQTVWVDLSAMRKVSTKWNTAVPL